MPTEAVAIDGVEALIAIEAIKQLKARFFLAVDQRDWAAYAALFTDDARFDVAAAFVDDAGESAVAGLDAAAAAVGGAAMATLVAQALDGAETVHIGTSPIIELIAADAAQAVWTVEDWLWPVGAPGQAPLHGFGYYQERYRRTSAGWCISHLAYVRTRWVNAPAGQI